MRNAEKIEVRPSLCKCSWSDNFVSKVISGFRQKWRKTFQIDLKCWTFQKDLQSDILNICQMWFLNFIAAQLQILPVSSESYNDTEHSVQVFMKRCHCIKGDVWFQTEVEEDILNRFKMLDISKRFKIWYFKYILNVVL